MDKGSGFNRLHPPLSYDQREVGHLKCRETQWVVKLLKWPSLQHVTTMRHWRTDHASSSPLAHWFRTKEGKREKNEGNDPVFITDVYFLQNSEFLQGVLKFTKMLYYREKKCNKYTHSEKNRCNLGASAKTLMMKLVKQCNQLVILW